MNSKIRTILVFPLRAIIVFAMVLDGIFRPLYRPVIRALSNLKIIQRLESRIAQLPRLVILLCLAVPFAIAEPMKIIGLVLFAHGAFKSGVVLTIIAHLSTFLIVERIYHAGREKLLTYGWLAWIMRYVRFARSFYDRLKLAALSWIKLRVLAQSR
ncbi:hypothetical protein WA845_17130 [Agrobacterium sp. CMT1]|uniref:hypothetical protein n=1 Tax=Agrobacterium TaxID=357 RepID=UPI000C2D33EC|nr:MULTISPECIES: hypothetical protein [Agrobacterium]AUC12856.1 hypothetical protein BLX90_21695 [Rhizobium sp. Y9]MDP9730122.1 hypothetical protein [Rhizobium sp. SORGH_AS_0285]MDP9753823.1 hypothetical protein [Rhizobium sp. SORGH_AS_0260]TGR67987.1 hypothetical protein EN837_15105 [bacterium M00.F.Ca.ET.194.01.1.1]TGS54088.1 hypothetical protein EN822_15100 [bacterium M00.F.Ca.ET.179.01.1.1]TGV46904.1 hypothetical protein EN811_15105 [bacterium M00.F.Ca.ET.168.01.1.1]